ncbi:ABC transporter ATP-binding protein, partial [Vibrio anguillarum]|nr:ABC transporter ATP-binding protein [Vibrio anguillarum]
DAKALVYDYPMFLMDNPVPDAHPNAKRIFGEFVQSKKGKATVIYTSHDPDLIKLADKVVVLNEGAVVYAGPLEPEQSSKQGQPSEPQTSQEQDPSAQQNAAPQEQ